MRDYERLSREASHLMQDNQQIRMQAAITKGNLELELWRAKDHRRLAQGKVLRQTKVIRRLEEKLKKRGQPPYESEAS